jgi:putative glycosyltransferase
MNHIGSAKISTEWRLTMPVSIVTTLYKSEPYINEFLARSLPLMGEADELIFVDDGSPDHSLALARERAMIDPRVVAIELTRNFGHHNAILAGLAYARHDRVFLIDSDLEEAPELLTEFSSIMDASSVDVVFGVHNHSQGSAFRRTTSKLFWRAFNWASDSNTPLDICNVRLMNRRYVDALMSLPEANVFLGGMFYWVGFKQLGVPIERRIMRAKSTYSIRSRISLAVRSMVSFSTAPLKLMFLSGMLISFLSTLLAMYYLALKLLDPAIQLGFTTLIISIWFLSGVIIACLGIIGIYLAYVYTETKRRPRTMVREIFRSEKR